MEKGRGRGGNSVWVLGGAIRLDARCPQGVKTEERRGRGYMYWGETDVFTSITHITLQYEKDQVERRRNCSDWPRRGVIFGSATTTS